MRSEALYLKDMVEAADAVERFLTGVEETAFLGSEMLQSAVLLKLIIIGEAAAHLSKEFRQRHADMEWSDIVAFRNLSVHAYFGVQWPIVWGTATEEVPELRRIVGGILESDYPVPASQEGEEGAQA